MSELTILIRLLLNRPTGIIATYKNFTISDPLTAGLETVRMIVMREEIVHIDAPYFCAGVISINDKIIYTAPILNYMKDWSIHRVFSYCKKKRWKWEKCKAYVDPKTKNPDPIKFARVEIRDSAPSRRRKKNNKSLQ
jgi:hypothetical protein